MIDYVEPELRYFEHINHLLDVQVISMEVSSLHLTHEGRSININQIKDLRLLSSATCIIIDFHCPIS